MRQILGLLLAMTACSAIVAAVDVEAMNAGVHGIDCKQIERHLISL